MTRDQFKTLATLVIMFILFLIGYKLNAPLVATTTTAIIYVNDQEVPISIETMRHETEITSTQFQGLAELDATIRFDFIPQRLQVFVCNQDISDRREIDFCPVIKIVRDGGYPWWSKALDKLTFIKRND